MKRLTIFLLIIFALPAFCFSQSDTSALGTIASKLQKLSATQPTEKVYLHFNKPGYNIGDTIWFKGYLTVGSHHQPSALSVILYVDLIDGNDKVIKALKLKNTNGVAAGDIAIDETLTPGTYRIRAYTNWMRNAGADYFFSKTFSFNTGKTGAVFITAAINMAGNGTDGLVNTKLTYTDKYGRPFDRKTVSYEVKADTTSIHKGTGVTDSNGVLNFAFGDKETNGKNRISLLNHIKILNSVIVDKTIQVSLQKDNIDVQFFPEGGQLVNDVRSKVAFKAIGADGLGATIKGVVLDNDNKEVAWFSSQHLGMGFFVLTPQTGKTYTAKITSADNQTHSLLLPIAAEKGFILAINNSDSTALSVRVLTNQATLQEKQNTSFYLVGQSAGAIYYTTLAKLDDVSFKASVPKNKFPSGIVQFTLFSANNEPLNERVVFIQNNTDLLNLNLKADKQTFAAKEKVNLTFNAKESNGQPALGSFSLSVFAEDKLAANENTESTILSNILLTSDLKGYIEEPNYYFNQPNEQTAADLDVLMLTQGYRRFDWRGIMADHFPQLAFQPEKSLSISGMLTNSAGKPLIKGKLKVVAPAAKMIIDTLTDGEGKFNIADVEIPDSTRMFIQARKANDGRTVNISLNNNTIPIINKAAIADIAKNIAPPYPNMMTGEADSLQVNVSTPTPKNKDGIKGLKEVTIKGKKEIAPNADNSYGIAVQTNLDMIKAGEYEYISGAIGRYNYRNTHFKFARINGRKVDIIELGNIYTADVESVTLVDATTLTPGYIAITTKSFAGTDTLKANKGLNDTKALKEVNIKAKRVALPTAYNAYGTAYQFNLSMTQARGYNSVFEAVHNRIPGVEGMGDKLSYERQPLPVAVVDEIEHDIVYLKTMDPADVETITLIKGTPRLRPNMILITTKAGMGTDTLKTGNTGIKKGQALKDVNIKGRKGDKNAPWVPRVTRSANLNGPGNASYVYVNKDLENCVDFLSCLMAKIPGVTPNNGSYYFSRRKVPIRFMLDGIMLNGTDMIETLNAINVESVEVLTNNAQLAIYGSEGFGGLVIVTTKIGDEGVDNSIAFKSVPGVIYTSFNGYYKAKNFYTPKYTPANIKTTDTRTAIYWNPNMVSDEKGSFAIQYFNSGIKGSYRAVVEGIDNDGNIGRYVYRYRVE